MELRKHLSLLFISILKHLIDNLIFLFPKTFLCLFRLYILSLQISFIHSDSILFFFGLPLIFSSLFLLLFHFLFLPLSTCFIVIRIITFQCSLILVDNKLEFNDLVKQFLVDVLAFIFLIFSENIIAVIIATTLRSHAEESPDFDHMLI